MDVVKHDDISRHGRGPDRAAEHESEIGLTRAER